MNDYRYRAIDRQGLPVKGQVQAQSREQAISRLQGDDLLIVEVGLRERHWGRLFTLQPRPDAGPVLRFTEQLATLLEAGQPLESALRLLARQRQPRAMRELLARLQQQVKAGASLSSAMSREGRNFSSFYLSLVRAGEASGTLVDALGQLAHYLERAQTQRGELASALIYPAFLLVGVLGSLVLLLAYVVPQFVPVFADLNIVLPALTEAVLGLGEVLVHWGLFIALAGVLSGAGVLLALREPHRRQALHGRLLRSAGLGGFLQALETARLAQTLGTLLSKRVALLASLDIARQVARNLAMRAALTQAAQAVREGLSLAIALERSGVFPELAMHMIRVGEQSGQLGEMLLRLARIYDRQVQTSTKRFMAALVPTLTLLMTLMVALIMLAILLPLMELTSTI
ncbi:type II secretion system F family protein [Pseudomonas huaxiensis]|uniref:type II secretion system F family protein n=1 Tax=Pseudomonas huaxiensis TaxID=2213017 RepID=UPI000DA674B9|nr:type II secretion system F family protein [Pseudomonas huaxiensis]